MAFHPVHYVTAVVFLLYHSCTGVDLCTTGTGILVNECVSGTGPGANTPGTGSGSSPDPPSSPQDVDPCKDYTYNGNAKQLYKYTASTPFTIKVKSHSVTGNGITIGRCTCQYGAAPEKCYVYTIQNTASTPLSFLKKNGKVFGIHGQGTLTFWIDDGNCVQIPTGYQKMNGQPGYLKVVKGAKNYANARADCRDDDPNGKSDLVVVQSKEKEDEVIRLLREKGVVQCWYGLTQDQGERYKYTWVNGDKVTAVDGVLYNDGTDGNGYQNWWLVEEIDQDRHDNQDCVIYNNGKWEDRWCDISTFDYACELIP